MMCAALLIGNSILTGASKSKQKITSHLFTQEKFVERQSIFGCHCILPCQK